MRRRDMLMGQPTVHRACERRYGWLKLLQSRGAHGQYYFVAITVTPVLSLMVD